MSTRRTKLLGAALVVLSAAFLSLGCSDKKGITITGVAPKQGRIMGGDRVTIMGTGFQSSGQQGVNVYFGKRKCTLISIESDERITCDSPAGPENEMVDVTVEFDDARQAKVPQAFKYIDTSGGMGNVKDLGVKKPE